MALLAYIPLLQPWSLGSAAWMLLMLPMVLGISVVYKTLHVEDLRRLPREAAIFTAQVIAFMAGAGAVLWLLTVLG